MEVVGVARVPFSGREERVSACLVVCCLLADLQAGPVFISPHIYAHWSGAS